MSGQSLRDQIAAKRAAAHSITAPARAAAARSSAQSASARGLGSPNVEVMEDKTVSGQIKRAGKTGKPSQHIAVLYMACHQLTRIGKLDLAALDLDRIPSDLYTSLLGIPASELSNPPAPPTASTSSDVKGMTSSFSAHLSLAEKSDRDAVFGRGTTREEWVEPEAELISFNAERNGIERIEREIGAFGGIKSINVSWSSSSDHYEIAATHITLAVEQPDIISSRLFR